jgi:hypothetical protein
VSCLLAVLMSRTGVSGLGARPTPLYLRWTLHTKQPHRVKQAKVDKFWPLPYEFPTSCFFPSHRSLHYCPGSYHFDTFDSSRTIGPVHLLSLPLFPSQSSNVFATTSVQIRPPACTGVKRTSLLSSIWIQGLPIYWPVITQAHQSHSM